MEREGTGTVAGVIYLTLMMMLFITSCHEKDTTLLPIPPAHNMSDFHEMILDEMRFSVGLLPDGDALVAEKNGRLRLVRNIHVEPVLEPQPLALINTCANEMLMGIAIHPDFSKNRLFYVCIAEMSNTTWHQRVELWQLSAARTSAKKDTLLLREIMTKSRKQSRELPMHFTIARQRAELKL
jgi:glucose/arabinose dehydrogenase